MYTGSHQIILPHLRFSAIMYLQIVRFLVLLALMILISACGASADPTPTPMPTLTVAQAQGKQLFGKLPGNCATCHALEANVTIVGPSLNGIANQAASRVPGLDARQYLEQSILKPDAYLIENFGDLMPKDLAKKLTTDEMNALVEYLLTLK